MSSETVLRDKLAACTRIFAMQQMMGLFGHISTYDPVAGRVYMSPSMGVDKATVSPDDILVADRTGKVLDGDRRLPIEWPIHTVLHARRDDALAVAHLHAPYATLFAVADREFRPVTLQGSVFDEGVPIYGEPRLVKTPEQGEALFSLLGREPRFRHVPVQMLDGIVRTLGILGMVWPAAARKAELARIGRYYATESMLVWDAEAERYDADATPSFGHETLFDHYGRLVAAEITAERGDHSVF